MSSFRLIIDADQSARFAPLGTAVQIAEPQLAVFHSRTMPIPKSIREQVLAANQAGITALAIPDQPWKAIFFDMDSTVIAEESIVEIARIAGKAAEVERITEQAMSGRLDFKTALRQRVAMLKGVPVNKLNELAASLTINPGMHEFARAAHKRGIELYLVSGGFIALAEPVSRELGFQGFRANELASAEGFLTGELLGPIIDANAKASYLQEICQQRSFNLAEVVAVGDGANDLAMLHKAGAAIGYHPKSVLLPHINGANLQDHRVLIHALL